MCSIHLHPSLRLWLEYFLADLDKNSSPPLSIFSVRDDYRVNGPARKAVLLTPRGGKEQ
jgi:hypothetical protein